MACWNFKTSNISHLWEMLLKHSHYWDPFFLLYSFCTWLLVFQKCKLFEIFSFLCHFLLMGNESSCLQHPLNTLKCSQVLKKLYTIYSGSASFNFFVLNLVSFGCSLILAFICLFSYTFGFPDILLISNCCAYFIFFLVF